MEEGESHHWPLRLAFPRVGMPCAVSSVDKLAAFEGQKWHRQHLELLS